MAEILIIKAVSDSELSELLSVYLSAGWWDTSSEDYRQIRTIIQKSFCFVVAKVDGKIIGMARSISDGISDAYIQDVAVLPEYKGGGVGKMLVDKVVAFLQDNNISWIGLIATPGAERFYQKSGFSVMENFTPMLLNNGKQNA